MLYTKGVAWGGTLPKNKERRKKRMHCLYPGLCPDVSSWCMSWT